VIACHLKSPKGACQRRHPRTVQPCPQGLPRDSQLCGHVSLGLIARLKCDHCSLCLFAGPAARLPLDNIKDRRLPIVQIPCTRNFQSRPWPEITNASPLAPERDPCPKLPVAPIPTEMRVAKPILDARRLAIKIKQHRSVRLGSDRKICHPSPRKRVKRVLVLVHADTRSAADDSTPIASSTVSGVASVDAIRSPVRTAPIYVMRKS
jgi:hypothetical protein